MRPCILVLSGVVLLLSGCSGDQETAGGLEGFGHLGEASGDGARGEYRFHYPYLLEDGRVAVAGISQFGEKPLSPAFLIVARLPSKNAFQRRVDFFSSDGRHLWSLGLDQSDGGKCIVKYEADEKKQEEGFWVLDRRYALENGGRLFAIDLTTKPPKVTRFRNDLAKVFADARPTREQFRAALQKLRAEEPVLASLFEE